MLHPAGMALFSEFDITNNIDLSIELESLVKSLGIGLEDDFTAFDNNVFFTISKVLSDALNTPSDSNFTKVTGKALTDSLSTPTDSFIQLVTKALTDSLSAPTDSFVQLVTKALTDTYSGMSDSLTSRDITKLLNDAPVISESLANTTTKYLQDTSIGTFTEAGQVWKNPYQSQDYFATTTYVEGLQQTFT
jgi:hypothetical protein